MLQIERYKRTKYDFTVLAVRVTEQNIKDVALWCGGDVARTLDDRKKLYVWIGQRKNNTRRKAFVGDWVLKFEHGEIKVYNKDGFHKSFDKVVTI